LVNIVARTTGGVATAPKSTPVCYSTDETHLRIVEALERLHHALFRPLGLKSPKINNQNTKFQPKRANDIL
jgi:hypothetical protein